MVYTKLTWGNNAECFFSFYALFNKFGNRLGTAENIAQAATRKPPLLK